MGANRSVPTHFHTERLASRLRKNYCGTVEIQWSVRLGQQENNAQGAQKGRPARPQRAKKRRRTFRYVELVSEARTPLADFFSIVLDGVMGGDKEGSQVPE